MASRLVGFLDPNNNCVTFWVGILPFFLVAVICDMLGCDVVISFIIANMCSVLDWPFCLVALPGTACYVYTLLCERIISFCYFIDFLLDLQSDRGDE